MKQGLIFDEVCAASLAVKRTFLHPRLLNAVNGA